MLKQVLGWGLVLATVVGMLESTRLRAQEPSTQIVSASPADKAATRINNTLLQQLRTPLSYDAEQLDIVLDAISEEYNIPIVFDKAALDEVAISPESELSINLRNISLRAALYLMFKEPGLEDLCYVVDQEVLLITTQDTANATLLVQVYRIDDLLDAMPRRFNDVSSQNDPDELIDVIIATIEADSWAENGVGEGEIQYFPPGMLVVSQTRWIHERVEDLLLKLRVAKNQSESSHVAASSHSQPATQGFALDVDFGENPDQGQKKLVSAIMQSVAWSSGEGQDGDNGQWIESLPDRLLVRHTPEVLSQVETVLRDMRVLDLAQHPRKFSGLGCGGLGSGAGKPAQPDLAE